jgi:hypothetical protein
VEKPPLLTEPLVVIQPLVIQPLVIKLLVIRLLVIKLLVIQPLLTKPQLHTLIITTINPVIAAITKVLLTNKLDNVTMTTTANPEKVIKLLFKACSQWGWCQVSSYATPSYSS